MAPIRLDASTMVGPISSLALMTLMTLASLRSTRAWHHISPRLSDFVIFFASHAVARYIGTVVVVQGLLLCRGRSWVRAFAFEPQTSQSDGDCLQVAAL